MADERYAGPPETAVPIPNAGPPPGHVKPSTGSGFGSKLPLLGLAARLAQIILAFIALIVMATTKKCGVSFSEFQAFSYFVAVMVLLLVWSIVMLVLEALGHFKNHSLADSRAFAIIRFIGEFIITFMVFSAASAAAGVISGLDSQGLCSACPGYCSQTQGAIAMGFLAWAVLVPSFLISGFACASLLH